jgi:hypothetical protein
MTKGRRPLVLTLHVVSSVGWLGAVAAFFVLAVRGAALTNPRTSLAAYAGMDLVARAVIVPACFASLLTGIVESIITPWGLLRHYWVFFKLLLTVAATALLVLHLGPIRYAAALASTEAVDLVALRPVARQLVVTSGAAILVLITTTVLSVYKPAGVLRSRTSARQTTQ